MDYRELRHNALLIAESIHTKQDFFDVNDIIKTASMFADFIDGVEKQETTTTIIGKISFEDFFKNVFLHTPLGPTSIASRDDISFTKAQQKYIDAVMSPYNSIIAHCRQSRFTSTMLIYSLYQAIYGDKKESIVILHPSNIGMYPHLLKSLMGSPDIISHVEEFTQHRISFKNGSSIMIIPVSETTYIPEATLIIIDEMAFVRYKTMDFVWKHQLQHRVKDTRCIFGSAPNKAEGLFYHLWNTTNKNNFVPCLTTYKDCDFTEDQIRYLRENLGEKFQYEYEGKFRPV